MTDVFTPRKRSEIMSRVRSKRNAATEMRAIRIFREYKIRGWRRDYRVQGAPDFVFPKKRVAVFVDGCFWHGCPMHGSEPRSNSRFWKAKLARNKSRDRLVTRNLRAKGWRVVRVWQHELSSPNRIVRRLLQAFMSG